MNELMESLEKWGADPKEALGRIMNDMPMFLRLLGKYVNSDEKEKLILAIRDERYFDAFRAAHEIKGVTSTLSLTPLVLTISRVVEDLRDASAPHPQLSLHMEQFLAQTSAFESIIHKHEDLLKDGTA